MNPRYSITKSRSRGQSLQSHGLPDHQEAVPSSTSVLGFATELGDDNEDGGADAHQQHDHQQCNEKPHGSPRAMVVFVAYASVPEPSILCAASRRLTQRLVAIRAHGHCRGGGEALDGGPGGSGGCGLALAVEGGAFIDVLRLMLVGGQEGLERLCHAGALGVFSLPK